ncbi:putative membrane protein, partial [Lachnellula occidentalis]
PIPSAKDSKKSQSNNHSANMTSYIARTVAKKILGESAKNNFGQEDPYFETVPATRLDGSPSKKTTKRRKALPPGISEHDGKVLTKVKRRAYRLDMCLFNCCGIRFGWSSVIGIVPFIGDALDCFMAMMVLRTCQQVEGGLPKDVQAKMMFNIIVDFGIGLVPFLGDIADALFRANTKNAVVLEKYLRQKGDKNLKQQGQVQNLSDPTDPDVFDRHLREELGPPPQYTTAPRSTHETRNVRPAQTQEANIPAESRGGWFSGFGSKKKQPDVEREPELRRREDEPLPSIPNDGSRLERNTDQRSRR